MLGLVLRKQHVYQFIIRPKDQIFGRIPATLFSQDELQRTGTVGVICGGTGVGVFGRGTRCAMVRMYGGKESMRGTADLELSAGEWREVQVSGGGRLI